MFDPLAAKLLRERVPDEPVRANLSGVSPAQRRALIALIYDAARLHPRQPRLRRWQVDGLGEHGMIADVTIVTLARDGLVVVIRASRPGEASRARLTPRGLWYARTAALDEAERLAAAALERAGSGR